MKKNKDVIKGMVDALVSALFIVAVFTFVTKATAVLFSTVEVELLFYFVMFIITFLMVGNSLKG